MKVGIDIVEVERFEKKSTKFFENIFTKNEINYCKNFNSKFEHFAGFFSAKEAVMKALGFGVEKISFLDIEILHNASKKPYVILTGNAKNIFEKMEEKTFEISISHTKKLATAIAILF